MKKRFTVLALAFAMVLTMSASVFAVDDNATAATAGQIDTPEAAQLVKYVKIPDGATNPNPTYTFKFTPTEKTGITTTKDNKQTTHDSVPVADFPKVGTSTTFNTSFKAETSAGVEGTSDVKGMKSIETIFDGVTFDHAGEYLYTVGEVSSDFTVTNNDKFVDSMTLDGQTYTLHLYVVNNDNGNGTHIESVTVEKTDGTKVDPSDDDPTPNTDAEKEARNDGSYKADGFTFTNNYSKVLKQHKDPDGNDANGAFDLKKVVTGKFGDKTKKFEFTVSYTLPKGYKNFTVATTGQTYADNKVELANNENLNFTTLPVGTVITVAENDYTPDNYKAASWATSATNNATEIKITEDGGYAVCTNERDDTAITPTGIIINNLPYVLLIGLALGGIVLFSRKRRYE